MENKTIYKKLADSKNEFGALVKDSTNPFFRSKYLSLNALLSTVEPVLYSNGLVLLQPIEDGKVMTKIICTDSGKGIESSIELPNIPDPQKLGSAITYFRRYSLQSLLGLQAEDDDANVATKAKQAPKSKPQSEIDPLVEKSIKLAFDKCNTLEDVKGIWTNNKEYQTKPFFIKLKDDRKKVLTQNGITE